MWIYMVHPLLIGLAPFFRPQNVASQPVILKNRFIYFPSAVNHTNRKREKEDT